MKNRSVNQRQLFLHSFITEFVKTGLPDLLTQVSCFYWQTRKWEDVVELCRPEGQTPPETTAEQHRERKSHTCSYYKHYPGRVKQQAFPGFQVKRNALYTVHNRVIHLPSPDEAVRIRAMRKLPDPLLSDCRADLDLSLRLQQGNGASGSRPGSCRSAEQTAQPTSPHPGLPLRRNRRFFQRMRMKSPLRDRLSCRAISAPGPHPGLPETLLHDLDGKLITPSAP